MAATVPKLTAYKQEAATSIDGMHDLAQQMVDSVFSFGEIGFQEFETQRYLTSILEREGFTIQRGIAGIPTAWTALRLWPPGDCARLGHRRHSTGIAEAGRRLSRADR